MNPAVHRDYVIVIVNGQQRTPEQIRQLVGEAYQMLKTTPPTERIVIKGKPDRHRPI